MRSLTFLLFFAFLTSHPLSAQDDAIMRDYARPTIANLLLHFTDENDEEAEIFSAFIDQPKSGKYNISQRLNDQYEIGVNRAVAYEGVGNGYKKGVTDRLRRIVADNAEFFPPQDPFGIQLGKTLSEKFNVGKDIMKEWATRSKDGIYTVIERRSQQNLSADQLQNRTDFTSEPYFKSLLLNNYVIAYDVVWLQQPGDDRIGFSVNGQNKEEVSAMVHAYIYALDIDETLYNQLSAVFDKPSKLGELNYPLRYIGHAAVKESFAPEVEYGAMQVVGNIKRDGFVKGLFGQNTNSNEPVDPKLMNPDAQGHEVNIAWTNLPREQRDTFIYNHLARKGFNDVIRLAEMNVDAFKVRCSVTGANPITAAVGVSEGVVADQRYRVYENKLANDGTICRLQLKSVPPFQPKSVPPG